MKKLILLILFCSVPVSAQNSFTQEWESPAGKNFHHIQNWESNNNIPEIILTDADNVYVYDGNTKSLKYTYSNPDSSYFYITNNGITSIPIDVNQDNVYEVFTSKSANSYKLKILNGATGSVMYQNTWTGFQGGTFYSLDIDGDGYTEVCIDLYNSYPNYSSKLLILSTTSHVIDVQNNTQKAAQYELGQNYPNPFNPNTVIEYSISKEANVKVSIYDILGQEVKVPVNEKQNSGSHKINFDGSGLASGTYFYQITVDGVPETKKMVLVK